MSARGTSPPARWSVADVPGCGWRNESSATWSARTPIPRPAITVVRCVSVVIGKLLRRVGAPASSKPQGGARVGPGVGGRGAVESWRGGSGDGGGGRGRRGLVLETRQPLEPLRQVPVRLAEQLHRGR